ncbi:MAG: rod shape-determining protein MreD [bacterium]
MRFIIIGGFIIFGVLLQTTVLNLIQIPLWGGIKPDLMLIIVVYFALSGGRIEGAFIGFASGLMKDVFSQGVVGVNALCLSIIGYSLGLVDGRIYKRNSIDQGFFVIASTVAYAILFFGVLRILGQRYALVENMKKVAVLACYNLIFGLPLFKLMDRLARKHLRKGRIQEGRISISR